MNIALLSEKYPPDIGGLAISVERLACLLQAAGHTVTVFALSSALPPCETSTQDQSGMHVLRLGIQHRTDDTLSAWADLIIHYSETLARGESSFDENVRLGERRNHSPNPASFDIIHGYFLTQAGFVAAYVGQMLGIPTVVSARGNDLDRAVFDPTKAAHVFYAMQYADVVTTNSRELARKAQALSSRPAVLIPNGVDAHLFQPQPPDETLRSQLDLQGAVLGFSGEARAKKGLAALLMAAAEIAACRSITLLLVGGVRSGEDKDLLKVFHKQHKDLRMVITEFVPLAEMPAYYNLMDVVVLPSRHDGLPNALLEAMACARPIVAGRAGGLPDALVDGENGLLVSPDDVPALVRGIETLLADPAHAAQLGQAARQTVLQRFTLEQERDRVLGLYQSLV